MSFSAMAVDAAGRLTLASFEALIPAPGASQSAAIYLEDSGAFRKIGEFDGIVRSMAWVGGELWVAGHFSLGALGPRGLAVWDGSSWRAPPGGPSDGPVYTLVVAGSKVLVGGSFSTIGGIAADSVAEWTGAAWRAYDMSGFTGPMRGDAVVFALATDAAGQLFAGGAFFRGTEATSGGIARWTQDGWQLVGEGVAAFDTGFGVVSDMAFYEGRLHITGTFQKEGGSDATPVVLANLAVLNGQRWEPIAGVSFAGLSTSWYHPIVYGIEPSGTAILETEFQRLFVHGPRLYVGGQFAGVGSVASKAVIDFDGAGWSPAPHPAKGLGLTGFASELAVGGPDCALYAMGAISHAGGAPGRSLRRFDGESWSQVELAFPEGSAPMTCSELAATHAGDLFLGCTTEFIPPSEPRPRIFKREGQGWAPLPPLPDQAVGTLWDLAIDPAQRPWVVGGGFGSGFIARLDGDHFTVVESRFDGPVFRIAFEPSSGGARYVVGGDFSHIETQSMNRIARWAVGTGWQPLGSGVSSPVLGLAYAKDAIFASTSADATKHLILGRWNGTAWDELAEPGIDLPLALTDGTQSASFQFYELIARGDHLIAAGSVHPQTGARHVFVHDGTQLTALGGGVGAISVETMAATPDELWFGGMIATTGHGADLAPSVGIARFRLGTPNQR